MREKSVFPEKLARVNLAPRFPVLDKNGGVLAANYQEFGQLPPEVQIAARRKVRE
jgi:hypothetical protein